jgi:hypothetical protein
LEDGIVPPRSLIALGVAGILLALVAWTVVFLVSRHQYKILGTAVIAVLLALIAWVITIWPAYWD